MRAGTRPEGAEHTPLLPLRSGPLLPLRRFVAAGVREALGEVPGGLAHYAAPSGDRGLFGPDSMAWRVHADLPGMLIGGFAALMFQTLHPLAMAGVAEHSLFREDPIGRLQRTGQFVAGTTYGPTPLAEELIARVQRVHDRVQGIAPDGRPYSANDPELLRFVHVTEVSSFLAAYQRYSPRPLLRVEKDRYFEEVAEIAYRLGATSVPTSLEEVRSYLRQIRPELASTPAAQEAFEFLRRPLNEGPVEVVAQRIIVAAAYDLLPASVRPFFDAPSELPRSRAVVRGAAATFSLAMRWAMGPSPLVALSRARALGELQRP